MQQSGFPVNCAAPTLAQSAEKSGSWDEKKTFPSTHSTIKVWNRIMVEKNLLLKVK